MWHAAHKMVKPKRAEPKYHGESFKLTLDSFNALAWVFMRRDLSCGVVLLNDEAQVLLCHATQTHHWDIPKGMPEPGETTCHAALRELREETGLVLEPEHLLDLGLFEYRRDKTLHLFAARLKASMANLEQCTCVSLFPSRYNGAMIPEMDAYQWVAEVDIARFASASLARLFERALPLTALDQRLREWAGSV